jgi:hypothetical protein
MCAKLGEFVRIIKAKSLIAKDFFRGEAFGNLLLKEFLHGVGCRNSIKHRCVALLYIQYIILHFYIVTLSIGNGYSAIIERR